MSLIDFNVDNENNITAEGNLLSTMNMIKPPTVSGCIRYMVTGLNMIEQSYVKALSNDNKIIGTERTDILMNIDAFFNTIILLWVLISSEKDKQHIILIGDGKNNASINITVNNEQWTAAGKFTQNTAATSANLNQALKEKLIPHANRFLNTYKNAVNDEILDEKERLFLKNDLNNLLYETTYLRFQISYCIIDG
ncbi:MAG: hypothetical protein JW982_04880 [Spirochaetes bacterium]|nr:hypothetical protein [Spirochaetota bacterium]